nr:hypothetical protein MFLOJ_58230 [Mycobacterium florentinum]
MPSASGGGGVQIDNPTQSGGALLVPAGATAVVGDFGATVVLLIAAGCAELEPGALGPDA